VREGRNHPFVVRPDVQGTENSGRAVSVGGVQDVTGRAASANMSIPNVDRSDR
jgi:hypothetical protein